MQCIQVAGRTRTNWVIKCVRISRMLCAVVGSAKNADKRAQALSHTHTQHRHIRNNEANFNAQV